MSEVWSSLVVVFVVVLLHLAAFESLPCMLVSVCPKVCGFPSPAAREDCFVWDSTEHCTAS